MNVTYNNYIYVNVCISVPTMIIPACDFGDSILLKEVYFQKPGSKNTRVTSFIHQLINFTVHSIAIERCDILQLQLLIRTCSLE